MRDREIITSANVGEISFAKNIQLSGTGNVTVQLNKVNPEEGKRMVRVKMLRDTPHPELGMLKKGEVVKVTRDYLRDYEAAGIAEESDDDLTPREAVAVCDKCGQTIPD